MKYIKTFQRYLSEERNKFYTLDLPKKLPKEDALFHLNELMPLILKMQKEGDVRISVEPVFMNVEK